ncbi:unnamed protein product, partial [Ixodes persulcatus]
GAKIIGDPTEREDDWSVLERYLDATQLLWMVVSCWLMSTGVQSCYLNISWLAVTGVAMSVLSHWVLNFGRRGRSATAPALGPLHNVERTFHNQQMKQTHSDTGIWVVPLDFNGPRSVRAHMSKGRKVHHVDCSQHVYCGMPYYFPVISKLRESYYIEAAGPIFHAKRKFELISQKMVLPNVRRLNFRLSGPSHMALVMSPRDGVELHGWSFTASVATKGVSWQGRPTYFVYFSQGKDVGAWDFWLELKV